MLGQIKAELIGFDQICFYGIITIDLKIMAI